jgi:hypothetical protein
MGKFKDYLFKEEVGLADLGTRIDGVLNSHWFGNAVNGALVSTGWSGSDGSQDSFNGYRLKAPESDLTVPSVQKQGRITTMLLKKNPIYVRLSDGTEAHFSYDEWQRIQGNSTSRKSNDYHLPETP